MKKRSVLSGAFITLGVLSAAASAVAVFAATKDIRLMWIVLLLGAVCVLSFLLLFLSERRSTKRLLTELSELLDNMSHCDYSPVFPEFDDSLVSKLQARVIRLTEVLVAQRESTEKERNDIKSLISDISHQLKTPVATLKAYGDLLKTEGLSEAERQQYLSAFSLALEKLVFLTDSLIKMSRLESGVITLKKEETKLRDVVLDAVMSVCTAAEKKGTDITFEPEKCTSLVMCDRHWTAEALFNIADNAVKYSPCNSVVAIDTAFFDMFVRVDITDSGRGIPPGEINGIFSRFYRGSNAVDEDGAGIGLYLSREIVTSQGGYIKVKSKPGETVFSVYLPVKFDFKK